jgi:hypothetical protein
LETEPDFTIRRGFLEAGYRCRNAGAGGSLFLKIEPQRLFLPGQCLGILRLKRMQPRFHLTDSRWKLKFGRNKEGLKKEDQANKNENPRYQDKNTKPGPSFPLHIEKYEAIWI